jgi:hypothetical protein
MNYTQLYNTAQKQAKGPTYDTRGVTSFGGNLLTKIPILDRLEKLREDIIRAKQQEAEAEYKKTKPSE